MEAHNVKVELLNIILSKDFRVEDLRLGVQGLVGFRIWGFGVRVWGLGPKGPLKVSETLSTKWHVNITTQLRSPMKSYMMMAARKELDALATSRVKRTNEQSCSATEKSKNTTAKTTFYISSIYLQCYSHD